MKRQILAALGIGVALLAAAGAVMSATYLHSNFSVNIITSPSATNTACHQESSDGFYLQAVQESGAGPMKGVEVKASPVTVCNGVETTTAVLLQATTNSSGLVHFPGFYGSYYKVTLTYSGQTYNYTAPMKTNKTTFVTIHLPSGSFETNYK
jgi:hypothetical protein